MLDEEQEETLRAYVDPVSKFFEVGLRFHIIIPFFITSRTLLSKRKTSLPSPKSQWGYGIM